MRTVVFATLVGIGFATSACNGFIGDSRQSPTDDDDLLGGDDLPAGCEITTTLARNGCTQSGCHGRSYQGNLDLASVGLAERLVNVRSRTTSCAGELLIDPAEPANSLILKATNPDAHGGSVCTDRMPLERDPMSPDDLACLASWVSEVVRDWGGEPIEPYVPPPPESYAAMVKTLLTGEALLTSDLTAVNANPENLKPLILGWTESPGFEAMMRELFANALQARTDRLRVTEFFGARGGRIIRAKGAQLVDDAKESVLKTAVDIVDQSRPFTEIVTTRRWYVNTALLTVIAFLDRTSAERTLAANRHTVTRGTTVIPIAESVSTKNWTFPQMEEQPDCRVTMLTEFDLLAAFMGSIFCPTTITLDEASRPLKDTDFTDWRYVTFQEGTSTTPWWDVPANRAATTYRVKNPRVGFFTQPAFIFNWVTNVDNDYRVLINQTMIGALDATFSAADPSPPFHESQIATEHAAPGTQCYGCHKNMDPMRGYFASTTDHAGAYQNDPTPASFSFFRQRRDADGIAAFADTIATHPRFALAWTQKLCMFANASRCDESDPEVVRIAGVFAASNFDFEALVAELFASPLVTRAEPVQTFETVEPFVSVTRQAHLCQLLRTRTGIANVCSNGNVLRALSQIAADSFARGEVDLVQASSTSAFHMAAAERLCNAVAPLAVTNTSRFRASDGAVLEKIVGDFMGLPPGHSRHDTSVAALRAHVTAATGAGATNENAVRSAFVAACLSTDILALGM